MVQRKTIYHLETKPKKRLVSFKHFKSLNQVKHFKRPKQSKTAYLVNGTLPPELLVRIGSELIALKDKVTLVNVCCSLHSFFQPDLVQLAISKLLHAIINDDRETVKKLLDKSPSLLMVEPKANMIIESKYTWQKFYVEKDALTMAVKLKQMKMIEILLPYYNKLPQTDEVIKAKAAALSAWKFYEIQRNVENEIVIPKEYEDLAQSLIDVFKDEDFPNGVPNENNNVELSRSTELVLSSLLNRLVPEMAVKLDEHIDVELLLIAICKAYNQVFLSFNRNKLDALCIRVMGLIQSALIPELGKLYCEGLQEVMRAIQQREEKEIGAKAKSHTMKDYHAFYRVSRNSRVGCGFNFMCAIFGDIGADAYWRVSCVEMSRIALENYVVLKQNDFKNLSKILIIASPTLS